MNEIIKVIIYSIVLLVCLFFSFVFSSADMTYGSVSIHKLDECIAKEPNRKSLLRAKRLATDYDRSIATILFGNDIVNAGLDSIATLLGVNLCGLILGADSTLSETWGFIASLIVLVFKICFGEIVPKSISKINNLKLARTYSTFITSLTYVFFFITYPVSLLGKGVSKLFSHSSVEEPIAQEELHEMIDDIEEHGQVDEEKADMLHDTIKYTQTQANEIMTPRVDLYAIDIDDPMDEIIKDHELYHHGRVPIYQGTIDNIVGYIQTKTLIKEYLANPEFSLKDILLEPMRFPDTAEINDILREFKKTKKQFALVMDEYGGLDGVITMEDILEEIVGEIWDENDRTQEPIVNCKDGSYIIDGSVTIEDYCDLFDIDFENIHTDYLTIGGFIVELLDDHFAKVGDEVDFENTHIKVISVDENDAVNRILVSRIEEKDE
jgi:putative hemolysin